MRPILCTLFLAVFFASPAAFATEAPTMEVGEKLFRSTDLGTNDRSCSTCHPGGEGLEDVDTWATDDLKEQVNTCIEQTLEGDALDADSTEMNSLILYIESF